MPLMLNFTSARVHVLLYVFEIACNFAADFCRRKQVCCSGVAPAFIAELFSSNEELLALTCAYVPALNFVHFHTAGLCSSNEGRHD